MRNWRKMTWALWVWSVLILVWAFGGGSSAASDCISDGGGGILSRSEVEAACNTGAGLGAAVILFFGFCGFVFLSLIWFMTRPREKHVVVLPAPPAPAFIPPPPVSMPAPPTATPVA